MHEVIAISGKRVFTLNEARELLPVVRRVTKTANDEVQKLTAELALASSPGKKEQLEAKVHALFQEWLAKVRKLGCEAKGMWLVDFDNGEGYYCWQYPESELSHFHGYTEGFRGRVRLH